MKKLAQGFNTAARIRTRVLVVESPKLYPEPLRSISIDNDKISFVSINLVSVTQWNILRRQSPICIILSVIYWAG